MRIASYLSAVSALLVAPLFAPANLFAQDIDLASLGGDSSVAAIESSSCACQPSCTEAICGQSSCCCGPTWEVYADALVMTRSYDYAPIAYFQDGFVDQGPALTTNRYDGQFEVGFQAYVRRGQIEARYMQINFDEAVQIDQDVRFMQLWYFTPASFRYTSDLYSGELNYIINDAEAPIRVSSGFRYLHLEEALIAKAPFFMGDDPVDSLGVSNNLYGWQVGLNATLPDRTNSPFKVTGYGNAGIYYADKYVNNSLTYVDFIDQSNQEGGVAFVGEVGLKGSVAITQWLDFSVGYQLMFVEGVATAGNQANSFQLVSPEPQDIVTTGLLYHGVTAGLTASW